MTVPLKNFKTFEVNQGRVYTESYCPCIYGKTVYPANSSSETIRFLTEYYKKFEKFSTIEFWINGESTSTSSGGVQPKAVIMSGTSMSYPTIYQSGLETWNNSVSQLNRTNTANLCSARQIANCSYSYHVIIYTGSYANYPTFYAECYGGDFSNSTACTEVFTGRIISSITNLYCIEMTFQPRKEGMTFRYRLYE